MTDIPRTRRWLGIDFSGNQKKWNLGCGGKSWKQRTVWIANLEQPENTIHLRDLRSAQELPGHGRPFERLVSRLQLSDFKAAGIDAPFSVPQQFMAGNHGALLKLVQGLDRNGRDFPERSVMFTGITGQAGTLDPAKPLRATESYWQRKGVNVRSTLWNGNARPGTAMTSACLRLLADADLPIWPWDTRGPSLLVEAFPAAQLHHWDLPNQEYDGQGTTACQVRKKILEGICAKFPFAEPTGDSRAKLLASADALDALICAFAARAICMPQCLGVALGEHRQKEGWIAVHA